MADSDYRDLVNFLRERSSGYLRGVGYFNQKTEEYGYPFVRDDVMESYTDEKIRRILQRAVVDESSKGYHDDLDEAGDLEYTLHKMENLILLRFSGGEDSVVL
ncbi:MAG: hypothetical protein SV377_04220, partial [Halobacteria archaeon]|nr:hypothetical protein [Halobacteria archaeon]